MASEWRCSLARGLGTPGLCDWCGRALTGRQKRWCSVTCATSFREQHIWAAARQAALERAGFMCEVCSDDEGLEVDHIHPLNGRGYGRGCRHHQDNLQVLCHDHHVEKTTADQARPGTVTQLRLVA